MRVSVLLPTYERPRLLREALESLRAQTMPRHAFEVILANDGGPHISPDVLDGLVGQVLNLPENRGQSAANNAALRIASGEYVTVAHDDDKVLPQKLSTLTAALDACGPEVSAVFGWPVYADAAGNESICPPNIRTFFDTHPVVTLQHAMEDGLFVHGTALLYRKSALDAIGGWDETLPTAEEFDLHLRLLHTQGVFRAVDVPVVTYRAGGKHLAYKGKRPRAVMDRIYAKVTTTGHAGLHTMGAF